MNTYIITPHIKAKADEIAKTVLMPGDPNRSEYVAKNFLQSAVLFNDIRGIKGYTGTYKGKKISVMASGMGIPSMGIYSHELYSIFNVENIIRIGTAGSIKQELDTKDIIIAQGACTDSNYLATFHLPGTFAPIASYSLLKKAVSILENKNMKYCVGNVLSSDVFYNDFSDDTLMWRKMGVLAIDMETAGLYANAARAGKNALTILTVSDNIITGEKLTPEEREISLNDMILTALDTAVEAENDD